MGAVGGENDGLHRSTRVRKSVVRGDYVNYLTRDRNPSDPETVEKAMKEESRKK